MSILTSIAARFSVKRLNQIDLFRKYPVEVQKQVFSQLIRDAVETKWGLNYGYSSIKTVSEFQSNVPVNPYEKLEPEIDKIRRGENNVLWPGSIKWFAKSSGTTNDKSKYIPVSKEALEYCHFRGGRDVMALYMNNYADSRILGGKGLIVGGSQQINKYNNDMYYGDLSAVLIQNLPFWVNFIRTPDVSIALMSEWEEKIERMADETIKENVTSISGVPSWTMVLIKRILEKTGKTNLCDVWPNLEVFIHGGVSFVPYREQYKQLIAFANMRYMETYNASEGFFGIQDDPTKDDMLLMLDYGIFYEFVPFENIGDENPKAYTVADVEIGKNYAMLISTNGGLWRYMIGDTVQFTSLFPHKIKITGRTKNFINAFGEELIVENAERALEAACRQTGASIKEYTAAPIYLQIGSKGGHEWLIEFVTQPNDICIFVEMLDETLKSLNSDYEAKRYKNISLDPPKVHIAREGVFYLWLKNKGKLGGQHKIPRLVNNRNYIDELLQLNKQQNI